MQRKYVAIGAILMLLSVALGAFGAHVLEPNIGEKATGTFETGVHYHMIHGIGIILAAFAAGLGADSRKLLWANRLFVLGIILFSGSLYLLAIAGWKWLGPITPLGGVSFMIGWLMFALAVKGRNK
ncbi:uncharacterized membrane protein YgdD (TMEM256/DUF423 family) [Fontibacillus solani]|uniref:Uncharacterized membrane protein YgdD, TMEM256/DUF423 family n=2 Tax=Fontibacillus TaxID=995014 RepID=A0A1G7KGY9_9BACL|nr:MULTISPECIES: DUF423 domain-containing protein [Fontibacillus]MBA9085067.1 uncharacterized membrane protein YgdD (TMEM256/DUF423 family) [Fontibacillus solani]SDF36099.1 Uncharacterized membrane protein YgdD, TMEM256/DUF423 family [Fontibacillus panacisegetis]